MDARFVFLLVLVGFVSAEKDCNEDRISSCSDNFKGLIWWGSNKEEACKELKDFEQCLTSAVEDCFVEDDENRREIEQNLKELQDLSKASCQSQGVVSAEKDCNEDRVSSCLDNFLGVILGDASEDEVCKELKDMSQCLTSAVEDCVDENDENRSEIEQNLKEIQDLTKVKCPSHDDDDDDEEVSFSDTCLQANKDYLLECMSETSSEVMRHFSTLENIDRNTVTCTTYSLISACMVERVEEKCGKEVSAAMQSELEDAPEEIQEACDKAGDLNFIGFESLLKKK